jgi:4a-hydroxytetrahydrobiopterin dehydratase
MSPLVEEQCEACRADAPRVNEQDAARLLRELPQWQIIGVDGIKRLQRVYSFADFVSAMAFTAKVGELAEQHGHHPALLTEWGRVTVSWWTHKIKGLHRNDFIMAAHTDRIA